MAWLGLSSPVPATSASDPAAGTGDEFVGLWRAQQRFGPDARGALILERSATGWTADFMGRIHPVRAGGQTLSFEIGNGEGAFAGQLQGGGHAIIGHWTSPNSKVHGSRYAAPVRLESAGADRWRGNVEPRHDEFTLYLMVQKRADGTLGAYLRNPERNIGVFNNIDRLERLGDTVRLIGRAMGAKAESALFTGEYDRDNEILVVLSRTEAGRTTSRAMATRQRLLPPRQAPGFLRLPAAAGPR